MKKIYLIALVVLGFSADSFAQDNLTTTTSPTIATATIITPISIGNTTPLSFGDIAVNTVDGTVVISGAGVRTATGGVKLPSTSTGTRADFTVEGLAGSTYSITLPTAITLTNDEVGAETMTVVPNCSIGLGAGVLTGGTQTFYVGGTLTVLGSQAPGNYSGEFNVSVVYN